MSRFGAWGASAHLVVGAALCCMIIIAVFPYRLEYAAHVIAGIGLAGIVVGWTTGGDRDRNGMSIDWRVALSVVGGVAVAGVASDLTVTGPLDVLDVTNTVMGGLMGLVILQSGWEVLPTERPGRVRLAVSGALIVSIGFSLRYPLQHLLKSVWWYGT